MTSDFNCSTWEYTWPTSSTFSPWTYEIYGIIHKYEIKHVIPHTVGAETSVTADLRQDSDLFS